MARPTTPKISQRVKVSILPSSDAKESVELDYRFLIPGNFSKSEPGSLGAVRDRRLRVINNKGDYKRALKDINPKPIVEVGYDGQLGRVGLVKGVEQVDVGEEVEVAQAGGVRVEHFHLAACAAREDALDGGLGSLPEGRVDHADRVEPVERGRLRLW